MGASTRRRAKHHASGRLHALSRGRCGESWAGLRYLETARPPNPDRSLPGRRRNEEDRDAMDPTLWLLVPAVLLVLVGLGGLVLPALPGAPIMFVGLVLAAWAEDFAYVGPFWLSVLGLLTILTYLVDFAAGAFGARRYGASKQAVIGAAIGAVVGLFFGIPGIILGPFLGAVIGEFSQRPDLRAAGKAGLGATLGLALGIAAKLSLAFTMLGLFLVVRFF
jgi:hypothetical protein